MKYYEIIETKNYKTIGELKNIVRIDIRHDSDGNYTDIRFVAYDKDSDSLKEYQLTMNQNSRIIIDDKENKQ